MKYTIEGFSQEYALTLQKEVEQDGKIKMIRVDCTDLLILRWYVDFYPRMMKTEIDGVQYAWVNYKELLNDMPILNMGRHSLAARLQKLVEFEVLKHITVKTNGTFSYYGFGKNYTKLLESERKQGIQQTGHGVQQTVQGIQQTGHPLYSKLDTPYTVNCTPNNSSTIYNSSTKDDYVCSADKPQTAPAAPKVKRFIKPTLEEVKAYCTERRNNVDAQHFIDYYESNGWKVGKNTMKDWKAAVRTWERNGYGNGGKNNAGTDTNSADRVYDEHGGYWEDGHYFY